MPSLAAIQAAEDKLGIPVTSAAVCTVRRMLDHLDLDPVVPAAGALLNGNYPASRLAFDGTQARDTTVD